MRLPWPAKRVSAPRILLTYSVDLRLNTVMSLRIETFVVGPLANNLYLLIDEEAHEAVLVDPSINSDPALQQMRALQQAGVRLSAIWLTHGHFDHVYDTAL